MRHIEGIQEFDGIIAISTRELQEIEMKN